MMLKMALKAGDSAALTASIAVRGHYLTTLTKFRPLLTTYLPRVDICQGISITVIRKNLQTVDISSGTYLP